MGQVMAGRYRALKQDALVVFLIGMRVNQWWAWGKWLPVASAMGPMLRVLYQQREKGFLGQETFFRFFPPEVMLITYWRSAQDLIDFAHNPDDPHLEPWRKFNRSIGSDGSVGIWHETYEVNAGNYESIYSNMPLFGLAAASSHGPATGKRPTTS